MKRNILTILLCCFVLASWAKDVVWYSGRGSVEYSFVGKRTGVVDMALNMFAEDMRAVTGHQPIAAGSISWEGRDLGRAASAPCAARRKSPRLRP